ncbi:hypothetical protein MCOR25_000524 [Pyricularia grisea]|uniref:Uncharacterized protein n=1 Tax=Pyricularia grisea TaxID=148305 RepID=A0A6P8B7Z8_PYRGI|nr:hypothetical protein PgNI_06198 [Pyricularia grisea]KAI6382713.1 hypothetical protein MCOR25_000524 [Pyricularia grisea]TLD11239.1 hypothetical protein PgNI_06198 [Pyricularia grisea]
METTTLSRRQSLVSPTEEAHLPTSTVDDIRIEPRSARTSSDRPPSLHAAADDGSKVAATAELASIMTIVSNPVSPGPSSPPLNEGVRPQDFIPPARPSSTPFPQPEPRNAEIKCTSCPAGAAPHDAHMQDMDAWDDPSLLLQQQPAVRAGLHFHDLPPEIHECILDHLFGYRVSATSKSSVGMHSVTKSWSTALRHSRRRELSELALVSSVWRALIQERLYRHIKIKATVGSVNGALVWFAQRPHLRPYVRHVEVWFPVFQPKPGSPATMVLQATSTLPTVTVDGLSASSYVLPVDNCSLDETFYFVGTTFPEVTVLTLEGGERKKAPKVTHFVYGDSTRRAQEASSQYSPFWESTVSENVERIMPKVPSVRTLVCKGQWNLIRSEEDFQHIMSALPNLQEWHGTYNKPKSKSYLTMAEILPRLPPQLKQLHLYLEADYRRELSFPAYFVKVTNRLHFCQRLGLAALGKPGSPSIEHLSYTGRVCRTFFDVLAQSADPRSTRLKSIDLTVKNCCRQVQIWNETGSGIMDVKFIAAFEALVLAGIKALKRLRALEYLRIRYVDLDSPIPALNPYFILRRDGWCEGVWSDKIVRALQASRPEARFRDLSDIPSFIGFGKDGRVVISAESMGKVTSFKLDNYRYLSAGGGFVVAA